MPKAESSSRSSSPTKGSPNKRTRGLAVPSFINVPYGVPASNVKLPALWTPKRNEEPPKQKPPLFVTSIPKGEPPKGIFVSDDIFRVGQAEAEAEAVAPEPSNEHTPSASSTEAMDEDFPQFNFDDLKEALDDSALSSGLGDLPKVKDAIGEEEPDPAEEEFLRTRYFPKLLALKAPTYLPLQCSSESCPSKHSAQFFRCQECFGGHMLCSKCIVSAHQHLPFHRVETWIDSKLDEGWIPGRWKPFAPPQFGYFRRIPLEQVGLQVPLGHSGRLCPASHPSDEHLMTVFHVNGYHKIRFRRCQCGEKDLWELLLEAGVFPATEKNPQTGFTIGLLRHQRTCNLRGKTSLKEYFDVLVELTDSAEGHGSVPNLYNQFRDVVRQYRVLCMFIRAGKYSNEGPLVDGELCVPCPACPSPGENLPPNWQDDPLKQLHYAKFLSGDGNFKLQRVARQQSSVDPPLRHKSMLGDAGFWVPEETLSKHTGSSEGLADEQTNPGKKSACNTMAGDPGYAPAGARLLDVTGVFCVSCRHVFICPNAVVDFRKGERYRPVDVCFSGPLNSSYQSGLRYFVITYDIACKYGVNFKKRCCDPSCKFVLIPTAEEEMFIVFCVNKFHQESHDDNCGAKNSLNYTKFVGRTCGEGVETIWAKLNWLRSSTREMSPGMRIEVLSEHFNDWNWQKVLGIVRYTSKKYTTSVLSLSIAQQQLDELKSSLGEREVSRLQSEYDALGGEKFYEDPTKVTWLSRTELLSEKGRAGPRGPIGTESAEVDHIDFICKALQLESTQAKLLQRQHDLTRIRDPIPALKARIADLKQELEAGLEAHYELLCSVAPQLGALGLTPGDAESDDIWLPSRFSSDEISQYALQDLLKVETQIRTGHAYNSIHELRQGLSLRSFWTRHITKQLKTQTKKTKGQASLQTANAQVRDAMRTYNVCWHWLMRVAPDRTAAFGLRKLNETDILALSDWQEGQEHKRSNKRLPWFWTLRPQPSAFPSQKDSVGADEPLSKLEQVIENWRSEFVRLDFVHSTASVERWVEEVAIIGREMAATCRAFQHKAMIWSERASQAFEASRAGGLSWETESQEMRGRVAYASRQFDLYIWLADSAYAEFQTAVGEENWAEIWNAPRALLF
ncbi:hypothetical protein M407DRAFT_29579 [Tulasnella calospora MUT 4182]|uniref:CxC2-like cysteine cluster KDZ transposase-associated domain-containing protein n=1 Tax=Tulasnella calospora MUT 4182 TaxID=1051891 RepID=A0A0C3KGZ5_9AGAM|nr:hypothetical protein M407DRAFT_29579 [Tulasnella calospora MUT 4182]